MQKSAIDWGVGQLWTWNVVTGCPRNCSVNGKPYCYAHRIHERFYKTPFSDVVFHPERLFDKMPTKPSHIFVGSMSDIQYWKPEWVNEIIQICRDCYGHTFMFLSKNPRSYFGFNWPNNCMLGLTITHSSNLNDRALDFHTRKGMEHTFLSIEPLMGILNKCVYYGRMEKIIVGAMTGPGAIPPKLEWVQSVKDNCPADRVFWKPNIRKYL